MLGFDETGWNYLVHTPLLHAALNKKWWSGGSLIEYSPWCVSVLLMASSANTP